VGIRGEGAGDRARERVQDGAQDREVLAIIPARAGSQSVPHKNLRSVGGQPLLARAIRAAQRSQSVTRVVVSTDGFEIGELARALGADVVARPLELATDTAPSELALLHALDWLQAREDYAPELTVFLQCTAPLMLARDIDGCVALLDDLDADSAFAAAPSHGFLWRRDASGSWEGVNHDPSNRPMRQEREPELLEAGSVYAFRTAGFRAARHRFFGRIELYEIPPERVLDIDEPEDLALADQILSRKRMSLPKGFCPQAAVFDFDGVLTDNRVIVDQDGRESVVCDRSDGAAMRRLRESGVEVLILSAEANSVVQARAQKLGVPVLQGIDDKLKALWAWLEEHGFAIDDTVYVGNDLNDLECLRLGVAVADSAPEALAAADVVLARGGGKGAVREISDHLIESVQRQRIAGER